MTARLVVLISGNGSNLQAILDACANGSLDAQVVAVISNLQAAFGLERARQSSIPAVVSQKLPGEDRRDYDARLAGIVAAYNPDFVVLAGWMRLLSGRFLDHFAGRVVNLHPALPGNFPGTHAIERAYEAFLEGRIDRSGVMVHLVPDEGVDNGPVLAFREVPFKKNESPDGFEARVHTLEHELLVETLQSLIAKMEETS